MINTQTAGMPVVTSMADLTLLNTTEERINHPLAIVAPTYGFGSAGVLSGSAEAQYSHEIMFYAGAPEEATPAEHTNDRMVYELTAAHQLPDTATAIPDGWYRLTAGAISISVYEEAP